MSTYIDKINSFNRFTEQHQTVSPGAQLLWFKLIDRANRSGWPDWFQVGAKTLMELIGVESKNTFNNYKNELLQLGLIDYKRGRRGKLSRFHINDFDKTTNRPILGSKFEPSYVSNNMSNKYPNPGLINELDQITPGEKRPLDKDKDKDKDNIDITNVISLSSNEDDSINLKKLKEFWNKHCGAMPKITCVRGKRLTTVKARIREFSKQDVRVAILNAEQSDFLNGNNKNGWIANFDWIFKPNNFPKVLEGNYNKSQNLNKMSDNDISNEQIENAKKIEYAIFDEFRKKREKNES